MERYKVFVQMPVILYEDKVEIVEAEISLPENYQPESGQWMYHKAFGGLMLLGPVIFDGDRDALVLTTVGSAYDYTVTLEEWLAGRPIWQKAPVPFITQEKVTRTPKRRRKTVDEDECDEA